MKSHIRAFRRWVIVSVYTGSFNLASPAWLGPTPTDALRSSRFKLFYPHHSKSFVRAGEGGAT